MQRATVRRDVFMDKLLIVALGRWGVKKWAILVVVIVLSSESALWAQTTNASVTGRVNDPSKAAITGASVTLSNQATNLQYVGKTNESGSYYLSDIPPGTYGMKIDKAGFKTVTKPEIVIHVQDVLEINLEMPVGSSTETVTVESGAPEIQLETSNISAVVDSRTVRDLPLNGRDWTQLAALQPGVEAVTTQRPANAGTPRGNRGFGQQLTVSGTRPQLNNYLVDGISIVDYAGGSPGGVTGLAVGVDAIGEFSVVTANASAEYGRTSGGVINAITRSGTNQLHGAVYEFLRNSALDARNYFDGATIPPFKRNQFGAAVGGPIKKNKMFFFGDYEGFRQSLGTTNISFVPSADARNGIIHNASGMPCTIGVTSPGCTYMNSAGTVGVDPLVVPFFTFYPLPNAGLLAPGDTGIFRFASNEVARDNFYTAKIGLKLSEKDSVAGSWFYDRSLNRAPDPLNDALIGNNSNRTMISLQETHIFNPSLINSFRGGFSRVAAVVAGSLQAINPAITDTAFGSLPGLPAPQLRVQGLQDFIGGGLGSLTANGYVWNSFQAYDDASMTKKAHSIKLGFDFERMQSNLVFPGSPGGVFNFNSLADFLTNSPARFLVNVPNTFSPRYIRQNLFGAYFQDDWRVRHNLVLNLGMRYEMVTVPTELHNKLSSLPTFTSAPPGHLGSPYFSNPSLRNFEPRFGFAWDPFSHGKTAVRGAVGVFDALPLNYEFSDVETKAAPFTELFTVTGLAQGTFPKGAASSIGGNIPATQLSWLSIQQKPRRNYVLIWNLNVQQQLTPSIAVMLGYVGNRGVHNLDRNGDVNTVLPAQNTPQGLLWPIPGTGTVLNPAVGAINGLYWNGDSRYNALLVQVTKSFTHGFQAQGSYTWGKNTDTGSAGPIEDPFSNSNGNLFFFCTPCRRGLSDYNIVHKVVANFIWDAPTPKDWGTLGSLFLGGWMVGGIFTAESGVPITPFIAGDPLGLGNSGPVAYPDRFTGPGCGSPVNPGNPTNYIKLNCFGVPMATPAIAAQCLAFPAVPGSCQNLLGNAARNSIVGPGLIDFDFSLTKNNHIRENLNLQFRAEFFNIFNRANFLTPFANSTLFDQTGSPIAGAGSITGTSTTAREIQFGLKLIW